MSANQLTKKTGPHVERYVFWFVAIALLFFQLGNTAPWQSEDRWLEIAREMLDSGNFFHPTLNDQLYFDKPLLTYWLVIAASFITHGLNEWSLRLPSALSALIALWGTRDLGRQLFSRDVLFSRDIGNTAGWILLTSFGFLQWGRLGEADMENLAATIVAVAWYWRYRERGHFVGYLIAYLIMAIGAQCKGLTAIVVPLGAIIIDSALAKRWRLHLNVQHAGAAAIAIGIYLLPFIFAAEPQQSNHASGLGLVLRENIIRYVSPFDHTGPIYTYLIAIPEYLFPWTLLFIGAITAALPRSTSATHEKRWLTLTTLFIFLFFTLSGSRRNYYILPILPYCAVFSAQYLRSAASSTRASILLRWSTLLCFLLFALFVTLPLTLPLIAPKFSGRTFSQIPPDVLHNIIFIGISGIALLVFTRLLRGRINDHSFVTLIVCAIVLFGGFFFRLQLDIDAARTEVPFARKLQALTEQATLPIAIVNDKPAGRLLFYAKLPRPVLVLDSRESLDTFIATPPYPKLLLAYRKDDAKLPAELQLLPPALVETTYAWEKDQREKLRAWLIFEPLKKSAPLKYSSLK